MNAQRNRTILLWLAALAILWSMLAPSLAATQAQQGKTWIEVCMSVGARLVALDLDTGSAGSDKAVHPGMHCPACVSQHGLAIISHPSGSQVLLDTPLDAGVRAHWPALWPASTFRTDHRSRAPPPAT